MLCRSIIPILFSVAANGRKDFLADAQGKLLEKAEVEDCSRSDNNQQSTSLTNADLVIEQRPKTAESESTAMAPDAPAADELLLYVRTFGGTVEAVELPSFATVADLRRALLAGQNTRGVLSFKGAEMVDRDALLSDLGVGPEAVVDVGPRTVVRVSILDKGYFSSESWCRWSKEKFDIPVDDFDDFVSALRLKILEKIQNASAGLDADLVSLLRKDELWLVPVDPQTGQQYTRDGLLRLESSWNVAIPKNRMGGIDWYTIYRTLSGESINVPGMSVGEPNVFFRIWKSVDTM